MCAAPCESARIGPAGYPVAQAAVTRHGFAALRSNCRPVLKSRGLAYKWNNLFSTMDRRTAPRTTWFGRPEVEEGSAMFSGIQ